MKNTMRPILVTGFEPYGGMASNPAFAAMQALNGTTIVEMPIVGRALPVAIARLDDVIDELLEAVNPAAVICLGLAPGEPAIRIERVGLNLTDFSLPDNEGHIRRDHPLAGAGPPAHWASLPVRRIADALLAAGIPVRLSETAGTYLCNACLYTFLDKLARAARPIPCGFIHVPMTPDLACAAIAAGRHDGIDRLPPPSMSLDLIIAAARIAIAETMAEIA